MTTPELLSAWFCPYAQRAWIAIEHKQVPYHLREVMSIAPDNISYIKKPQLLEFSPNGMVPCFVEEGRSVHDSLVVLEFFEDRFPDSPSLPVQECVLRPAPSRAPLTIACHIYLQAAHRSVRAG